MDLHPLDIWLEAKGITPNKFATDNDIPFRSIYAHISGDVIDPRLDVLLTIEDATKGAVTVSDQVEWFKELREARRANKRR